MAFSASGLETGLQRLWRSGTRLLAGCGFGRNGTATLGSHNSCYVTSPSRRSFPRAHEPTAMVAPGGFRQSTRPRGAAACPGAAPRRPESPRCLLAPSDLRRSCRGAPRPPGTSERHRGRRFPPGDGWQRGTGDGVSRVPSRALSAMAFNICAAAPLASSARPWVRRWRLASRYFCVVMAFPTRSSSSHRCVKVPAVLTQCVWA